MRCCQRFVVVVMAALAAPTALAQAPLGTAFTYQGQLNESGQPFNGSANLLFRLYEVPTGGSPLGSQSLRNTEITNGLFSVELNGNGEFGADAFKGDERWLEIEVNGVTLSGRQRINATPYALFALTAPSPIVTVSTVAELLDALTRLPVGGGRILVRRGTYTLTQPVIVNRDNVVIEGEGSSTYFRLADGANCPCFILGDPMCVPLVIRRSIALRHLRIDGNRNGQSSEFWGACPDGGQRITNNCVTIRRCMDTSLEDVILESARSGGVVTEHGCENILIKRVTAFDHHFDGIACYVTTRSLILDCTARDNQFAGLSCDLGFRDNIVANCFFINNGLNVSVPTVRHPGVFWRDATGNLLVNSRLSGNMGDGIFVADGAGKLPTSENQFVDNFYTDNGRVGFRQDGPNSADNVLQGGIFKGNADGAIEESWPEAPLIQYDVTILP